MGGKNERNAVKYCKRGVSFFFEFVERIRKLYPEIYQQGTSEGQEASDYFKKWGWYATIVDLTDTTEDGIGDITKVDQVMNMTIHQIHIFLAHRIDKQKLREQLRRKHSRK